MNKNHNKTKLEACQEDLRQANKRIAELEKKLEVLRPRMAKDSIDGWSVQKSGKYYRCFKKIDGKLHGIFIGKKRDEEVARKKIQAKLESLGLAEKGAKNKKD